jgi:hypothetical protein
MTVPGQLTAKLPSSPHANISVTHRIGATKSGSAVWQVDCSCGVVLTGPAERIRSGAIRCATCNPSRTVTQASRVLSAMPAGYAKIEGKTKLRRPQVEYSLEWLRARGMCFVGGWAHAEMQGSFSPIFHAGKGADVPCTLKHRTRQASERRYRKRIKRAIEMAESGGKENPRYLRRIALHKAEQTARRTRTEPQNPFSALFSQQGARP